MQSYYLQSFSSVFRVAGQFQPNVAEVTSYLMPLGICGKYCLERAESLKTSSLNVVLVTRHLQVSKGTKFHHHQLQLLCSSTLNVQLVALFSNTSTTLTIFLGL